MRNAEFGILEKRGLKSDRALRIPQLRDEVWNSFHAKAGNPTTLLTRFAEELPPSPRLRRTCRRAPEAGGVIFNFAFLMFDYWRVRKWESENMVSRVWDARMCF
jgi:hypothetical protein